MIDCISSLAPIVGQPVEQEPHEEQPADIESHHVQSLTPADLPAQNDTEAAVAAPASQPVVNAQPAPSQRTLSRRERRRRAKMKAHTGPRP